MKIVDEKPIISAEVKKILLEKSKQKELVYEQKIALEYLKKFSKLPITKAKKMAEELAKIEKLNEKHIAVITDFLPKDLDDLRLLFSNERVELSPEDKKKILSVVKSNT